MYIYRKNNSKTGAEKAKKKQRKTLYLEKNFSSFSLDQCKGIKVILIPNWPLVNIKLKKKFKKIIYLMPFRS